MEPTLEPARILGSSLHSKSPRHTPCRGWGNGHICFILMFDPGRLP